MAGIMGRKDIVAFGLCAHPRVPSASCCKVVKTVDKNCLCAQLKSGSYPKQMVENALLLPKKCGRTNLAGFRCGAYTVPH
ncbi:hypothetical protein BDL97_09G008500 [Sphagnum fallax]|nr:hypothetical protein BDL97_09G008500 [Sphagnum fallax]